MQKALTAEQLAKGKECSEKMALLLKEYGFGLTVETKHTPILTPIEPEVVEAEVVKE